ncbi:hypothetical protein LUZ60_003708 [Juncus effusus]|nr:hypothetical protein LUZ60_003708 [Juncus effusus]
METQSSQTDDQLTESFLSLGLSTSQKGITDFPRVLLLLSSFLDRAIHRNEKLATNPNPNSLTVFHGLKAPNLGIQRYLERIYKYAKCSPSCFVLGLVYMDRYLEKEKSVVVTSLNVHRLVVTSVVLAAKFSDDAFFNNAYYAKVGGISTKEMNRLELNLLFCIDFRLRVDVSTFGKYCIQLEKEATIYQVEWPIKAACGLLTDVNNIEDKNCRAVSQRIVEL